MRGGGNDDYEKRECADGDEAGSGIQSKVKSSQLEQRSGGLLLLLLLSSQNCRSPPANQSTHLCLLLLNLHALCKSSSIFGHRSATNRAVNDVQACHSSSCLHYTDTPFTGNIRPLTQLLTTTQTYIRRRVTLVLRAAELMSMSSEQSFIIITAPK